MYLCCVDLRTASATRKSGEKKDTYLDVRCVQRCFMIYVNDDDYVYEKTKMNYVPGTKRFNFSIFFVFFEEKKNIENHNGAICCVIHETAI